MGKSHTFITLFQGGALGSILTGIFAQQWIAGLDGTTISPGWVDGNFIQVPYQMLAITVTAVWSFVVSYILLFIIDRIPGLQLRACGDKELLGTDDAEMGETAYDLVGKQFALNHAMIQKELSAEMVEKDGRPLVTRDGRKVSPETVSLELL